LGLDIGEKVLDGVGTGVGLETETEVFLSGFLEKFLFDDDQGNG
jgi:hypothetical protein